MIITDIGFHPRSKKIMLFLGSILLIPIIASHKCYVCGPNSSDLNTSNLSCDQFDRHDIKYIQECMPETKGCSVQINGTTETRSCEKIAVNDCKTANNVTYCYCRVELCNASNFTGKYPSPSDDEDTDIEGSGQRNSDITITISDITNKMTPIVIPTVTEAIPNDSSKCLAKAHNFRFLLISITLFCYRSYLFLS